MKGFVQEFKEFITKGNIMDMAVGIIMGTAFTAIVTSLVEDIISPLLGLIVGINFSELKGTVGDVTFTYGNFIMAVINFFLIALVMFLLIKALMKFQAASDKARGIDRTETLATKECPYCKTEIALEATRCPNCTSELGVFEEETTK